MTGSKRKITSENNSERPSKISKEEIDEIKQLVNQVENEEFEEINENTLKKLILSFEKKYLKNQQLRNKYQNEPEKFMESEIDLHEEIKKLQIIATVPDLYKLFTSLGSIVSLGSLIFHENSDISIEVIDLFNELIEAEDIEQDEELSLFNSFLKNNILETLIDNLSRLDLSQDNNGGDDDERIAIINTFTIIEKMLELDNESNNKLGKVSVILSSKSNIFKYLLQYITTTTTPISIKLFSSELLFTILLNDNTCHTSFGSGKKYQAIEKLLLTLSPYLKKQPDSLQETEFVQNIFSSLCSLLFQNNENKDYFLKSEGIQLMLLFIKKKTHQRGAALKVLDYSLTDSKKSCELFVQELGLKTVFSSLMKKIKTKHSKKVYNESEDQEHIINILYALLSNLESNSDSFNRLLVKFTENNFEKIDKLLELHFKYFKKVQLADLKIRKEKNIMKQQQEDDDNSDDEEEILIKRLGAGLFTLQFIDIILALLLNQNQDIKNKLKSQENSNELLNEIKSILNEYHNTSEKENESNLIKSLIDSI